jgi:hypothetical protein
VLHEVHSRQAAAAPGTLSEPRDDRAEPIRRPTRRGRLNLGPMFTIVIGTDGAGEFPMLLREEDVLPGGDTRWRRVAQTDDYAEAVGVVDLLHRRCFSESPGVA